MSDNLPKLQAQMKRASKLADAWIEHAICLDDPDTDSTYNDLVLGAQVEMSMKAIELCSSAGSGDWDMIAHKAGISPPSDATAILCIFALYERARGLGIEAK